MGKSGENSKEQCEENRVPPTMIFGFQDAERAVVIRHGIDI